VTALQITAIDNGFQRVDAPFTGNDPRPGFLAPSPSRPPASRRRSSRSPPRSCPCCPAPCPDQLQRSFRPRRRHQHHLGDTSPANFTYQVVIPSRRSRRQPGFRPPGTTPTSAARTRQHHERHHQAARAHRRPDGDFRHGHGSGQRATAGLPGGTAAGT
jgi:hypothetical protein